MADYILMPGDRITLPPEKPSTVAPHDVAQWLNARGWWQTDSQFEGAWGHQTRDQGGFTWEQAVAYEFFRFATLGGNDHG
jgi:hypothetical protein